MITFSDWVKLKENQMRDVAKGGYPPQMGAANYPPSYFTPISADAGRSFSKGGANYKYTKKKKKKKKS